MTNHKTFHLSSGFAKCLNYVDDYATPMQVEYAKGIFRDACNLGDPHVQPKAVHYFGLFCEMILEANKHAGANTFSIFDIPSWIQDESKRDMIDMFIKTPRYKEYCKMYNTFSKNYQMEKMMPILRFFQGVQNLIHQTN